MNFTDVGYEHQVTLAPGAARESLTFLKTCAQGALAELFIDAARLAGKAQDTLWFNFPVGCIGPAEGQSHCVQGFVDGLTGTLAVDVLQSLDDVQDPPRVGHRVSQVGLQAVVLDGLHDARKCGGRRQGGFGLAGGSVGFACGHV